MKSIVLEINREYYLDIDLKKNHLEIDKHKEIDNGSYYLVCLTTNNYLYFFKTFFYFYLFI